MEEEEEKNKEEKDAGTHKEDNDADMQGVECWGEEQRHERMDEQGEHKEGGTMPEQTVEEEFRQGDTSVREEQSTLGQGHIALGRSFSRPHVRNSTVFSVFES